MDTISKHHADSNIGGRSENQDAVACGDTKFGFLGIVCDGMGGGKGGKLAAQIALDVIQEDLRGSASEDSVNAVYNAIQKANFEVFRTGLNDKDLKGMGTTVALVLISENGAHVAHVGDSRVYQIRNGKTIQRTQDHSVVFRMLKEGILTNEEQARKHPKSNQITRALGLKPVVDIELNSFSYEKGDYFFLCSDGVNGELDDSEIEQLHETLQEPRHIVNESIKRVNAKGMARGGGHDNASAVSIFCIGASKLSGSGKEVPPKRSSKYNTSVLLPVLLGVALCVSLFTLVRLKSGNGDYEQQLKTARSINEKLEKTVDSLRNKVERENPETGMGNLGGIGNDSVERGISLSDTLVRPAVVGDTVAVE